MCNVSMRKIWHFHSIQMIFSYQSKSLITDDAHRTIVKLQKILSQLLYKVLISLTQ